MLKFHEFYPLHHFARAMFFSVFPLHYRQPHGVWNGNGSRARFHCWRDYLPRTEHTAMYYYSLTSSQR